MNMIPLLVAVVLFAGTAAAAMTNASQMFHSNYMETLCRMQNVQTHALENLEQEEPLVADFGGAECVPPTWTPVPTLVPTTAPTTAPTSTPPPSPAATSTPAA